MSRTMILSLLATCTFLGQSGFLTKSLSSALIQGQWHLYRNPGISVMFEGDKLHLKGCRNFSCPYYADSGDFDVQGECIETGQACRHKREYLHIHAFKQVNKYKVGQNKLSMKDERGKTVLEFWKTS